MTAIPEEILEKISNLRRELIKDFAIGGLMFTFLGAAGAAYCFTDSHNTQDDEVTTSQADVRENFIISEDQRKILLNLAGGLSVIVTMGGLSLMGLSAHKARKLRNEKPEQGFDFN